MKKLITSFLFIFGSVAFAQPSSFIEKLDDGDITVKPQSFINALSIADGIEYSGLTFLFTPKDKSSPEENYFKVQVKTCSDKTTSLFETNKNGLLRDFQVVNLEKATALNDKMAVAICNNHSQYKKSPEQFRYSAFFIKNVINNSSPNQWITMLADERNDISILKEYYIVEKGIFKAVIRIQDLTENKKVTSTEFGKYSFPLNECSAKIVNLEIERLESGVKSQMPIDMSDKTGSTLIVKSCQLPKQL